MRIPGLVIQKRHLVKECAPGRCEEYSRFDNVSVQASGPTPSSHNSYILAYSELLREWYACPHLEWVPVHEVIPDILWFHDCVHPYAEPESQGFSKSRLSHKSLAARANIVRYGGLPAE